MLSKIASRRTGPSQPMKRISPATAAGHIDSQEDAATLVDALPASQHPGDGRPTKKRLASSKDVERDVSEFGPIGRRWTSLPETTIQREGAAVLRRGSVRQAETLSRRPWRGAPAPTSRRGKRSREH
jgi:hypothetical protein